MSRPKRCPFCCGKAERIEHQHKYGHKQYAICCLNDKCLIQPCTALYTKKGADTRAWNRRADNERQADRVNHGNRHQMW